MFTFERNINGLGSAGNNVHCEIFKVDKTHLCDRAMPVRSAAAMCLIALINQNNFMYTNEFEGNVTLDFRALDAALLAATQETISNPSQTREFLHGNIGFLKSNTTERIKGPITVQRVIRIGLTHTYVELALSIAGNPRSLKSHVDSVYSRKCITFILRSVIGSRLGEKARFAAAKELPAIITRFITLQLIPNNINSSPTSTNELNISTSSSSLNSSTNSIIQSYASLSTSTFDLSSSNIEYTQHILICALHELSLLVQSFGTSTSLLLQDSCHGLIDILFLVILNASHSVR
ncbi:unnamed protein product [Rotaria sp. Silwood2]|nr:unnamed protein product [Rotaria sp. Silwood2]CAF4318205.1 unnamed protein product [Rotaria sp. Silwood2]